MVDLINSMQDRELVIKEENKPKLLNILRKYGEVVDYMTEPMVAKFYGVNQKTIEQIANRNGKELNNYGYKVYKRSEILNLQLVGLENIPNRGLRLYPIKAVIVTGMMLTESKVAEQLRSEIVKELFDNTPVIDPLIFNLNDIVNASRNGDDVKLAIAIGQRDKLIEDRIIEEKVKPLENEIEELEPKAEKYTTIYNSDNLYKTTDVAKDLGMSATKLNKILNEKGIIFKKGTTWYFYSKYEDMVPEYADYIINEYGQQLRWTNKGREWIINLLNK